MVAYEVLYMMCLCSRIAKKGVGLPTPECSGTPATYSLVITGGGNDQIVAVGTLAVGTIKYWPWE